MQGDMIDRIDNAIARVKASRAAAEVMAEIETTHVLVPRSLVRRAAEAQGFNGRFDREVVSNELAAYWKDANEGNHTP